MVTQKKQSQVQELVDLLAKYKNLALIKFEKTTHQSLESLRSELKKTSSTFKVIKNTLFQKAVNRLAHTNKSYLSLKKQYFPLKDNSALLVLQSDWSEGLGTFYKFMQGEKSLSFKCAILDNSVYLNEEVEKIAKLPSKKELVGKILGSFQSPTYRFVRSLKFGTQKFLFIISQKSKQTN